VVVRAPEEIILPANVPRGGEVEAKARRELAGYYAHIEGTDRAIGRLLAEVDAIGGADGEGARRGRRGSIVIFTSVHGDMHGAHGLFRKGWPHEESVRVPLIVRGAHEGEMEEGRGRIDDRAVSLVDLHAMTLAWADGESALGARRTTSAGISMPSVVALPHQCDRVWRGVRTAKRKLVLNADGSPWLFFDLENDAGEQHNLAGDPTRAAEIAALARLV
jgi:arylsulfatase A-like enzyme